MIFKFQAWERKIVIKADYSYKINKTLWLITCESSPSEVFLGKVVQKLCSKFPEENPYRSMQSKFIDIIIRHGYSPENMQYIFRTLFPKNAFGGLLLNLRKSYVTF